FERLVEIKRDDFLFALALNFNIPHIGVKDICGAFHLFFGGSGWALAVGGGSLRGHQRCHCERSEANLQQPQDCFVARLLAMTTHGYPRSMVKRLSLPARRSRASASGRNEPS